MNMTTTSGASGVVYNVTENTYLTTSDELIASLVLESFTIVLICFFILCVGFAFLVVCVCLAAILEETNKGQKGKSRILIPSRKLLNKLKASIKNNNDFEMVDVEQDADGFNDNDL